MKTVIALPDALVASAGDLAHRLGISRSELYARAVEECVALHRGEDVTVRLNQVYGRDSAAMDPALRGAQRRAIAPDSSETW